MSLEFSFESIVFIAQICVYEDSSYLLEKYWYTETSSYQ